jgi:hypothetical protein
MMTHVHAVAEHRRTGWAGPRAATVIGVVVVAAGIGVGVLRYVGTDPPETPLERLLGAVALGAVVAAPGILALLARTDRPALLLPAAGVLGLCSFLSFVLLPLLVASGLLFVVFVVRIAERPPPVLRTLAAVAWVSIVLLAAVVALFVHADPRTRTVGTSTYGTSDVLTAIESLISLGRGATAITGGWLLASPTPRFSARLTSVRS